MEKKNRRTFLQMMTIGIVSLFVVFWNKLTLTHLNLADHKVNVFPVNKNKQVSFFKNFIVINKRGAITVLSAHCTHLGCTISKLEKGHLVCPCHGSEFDLEGKVLKGPAFKNLEKIPAKITKDGTQIEVKG